MIIFVLTALYLALGFLIFFRLAGGLLCFFIPLIMASTFGTKSYCNKYCGRGQLFELIGNSWKLSPKRDIPPGCAHIPSVMASCCFLQRCLSICWFLPTWSLPMLSIFIRQSACCGLLTYHGTGLTGGGACRAGRAICFWIFTASCADLQHSRYHHAAAVQAAFLVRLLPYGHDNAAHLPLETS